MSFIYLASPYSHSEASIREARFKEAEAATVWFLKQKVWVYSPIVHCHALAKEHNLPTDAGFWQEFNHTMIERSSGVIVLGIEGWQESKGVKDEISFAREMGLEVSLVSWTSQGYKYKLLASQIPYHAQTD